MIPHKNHIIRTLCLLLALNGLMALQAGAADHDAWEIMSPMPNSEVKSGEVFMAVKYKDLLKLQHNSIQVFLDGYLVTNNIKVNNDQITLLYLLPLKPGKHMFEVQASAYHFGWLTPLKWVFYIKGQTGPDGSIIGDSSLNKNKKTKFEWTGNVSVQYRRFLLSAGTDSSIRQRQELPYTRTLSLNTVMKIGKVAFPVQYYNTSDEYNYDYRGPQSMNYFSIGAQTRWFEATYGDMNPNFDRLALPGTRVHGYSVALKRKRSKIQVLDGYLQRPLEGQQLRYYNVGLPPANLRFDSTYIQPGIYKRRISAMRLSFGNKEEGSVIGINVLKVKDDVSSIRYGTSPKDNLVLSYDQSVVTSDNKMRISGGVACSFLTEDISSGALEKKLVDSLYGTDLPVDPYKYRQILVINTTTHKPDRQSAAGFVNGTFNAKRNSLMIEYRYIGGTYQSLANPFLRSDLRGATIQDQAYLMKRKVILTGRYTLRLSNLSGGQFTNINSHLGNASLLIAPRPKLPQLSVFYNLQWRISTPAASKLVMANDMLHSYGGNLSYNFKLAKCYNGLSFQYFRNLRVDKIFSTNNSSVENYTGGINEVLTPLNVTLDFQYSKMLYTDNSGAMYPMYDMMTGRLRYSLKKLKSDFGVSVYRNHFHSTPLTPSASDRNTYSGFYSGKFIKNMVFDLEGGISPFLNKDYEALSYNESYFLVRLSYDFNVR